ncbi:hypothetical protein IG631_16529 [Alternaria alternata]|nr:hypothetical protein IG631_16529 [Alternaria alternata]
MSFEQQPTKSLLHSVFISQACEVQQCHRYRKYTSRNPTCESNLPDPGSCCDACASWDSASSRGAARLCLRSMTHPKPYRRATKPSKRFQDNAEKKERPQRFPKAARFQDSRASPKHRYSAICAQSLALSQTRVRLVTVPWNPRAKWPSNTCHSQQRRAKDHKVGHSSRDVMCEEDFQSVPSRHAAHITILCMAAVSYPGFPTFLRSALKPPRG